MKADLTSTRSGPDPDRAGNREPLRKRRGKPGHLDEGGSSMMKSYEKPRVIFAEKVEARAATCAKATSADCAAGPNQS